jgi:hypothetical protein
VLLLYNIIIRFDINGVVFIDSTKNHGIIKYNKMYYMMPNTLFFIYGGRLYSVLMHFEKAATLNFVYIIMGCAQRTLIMFVLRSLCLKIIELQ